MKLKHVTFDQWLYVLAFSLLAGVASASWTGFFIALAFWYPLALIAANML